MADWNNPTTSSTYTDVITEIKNRDLDVAKGLDPTAVTVTNPVANMIRYNSSLSKWQKFDGITWEDLASSYAINVTTLGGSAASAYAKLASPAFTGNPTATTQAVDNNSTRLATTAFYAGQRGTTTPLMDGTATAGTSLRFTSQDHRHPTDTSRAPLASPAFTGTPTAPTAAAGTNTTQLATTAFVKSSRVGFMGYRTTDFSINSTSYVTITYNGENTDTHGAFDPATGTFTAPFSGLVSFRGSFVTTKEVSGLFTIGIFVNGTVVPGTEKSIAEAGGTAGALLVTDAVLSLTVGDTVNMRVKGSAVSTNDTIRGAFMGS